MQADSNPDLEQQIQLQTYLMQQEQVLTVTAHTINEAMAVAPTPTQPGRRLARSHVWGQMS